MCSGNMCVKCIMCMSGIHPPLSMCTPADFVSTPLCLLNCTEKELLIPLIFMRTRVYNILYSVQYSIHFQ